MAYRVRHVWKVKHRDLAPISMLSEGQCNMLEKFVFGGLATCLYCGKKFHRSHGLKKYCSTTCKSNFNYKKQQYIDLIELEDDLYYSDYDEEILGGYYED